MIRQLTFDELERDALGYWPPVITPYQNPTGVDGMTMAHWEHRTDRRRNAVTVSSCLGYGCAEASLTQLTEDNLAWHTRALLNMVALRAPAGTAQHDGGLPCDD